MPRLLTLVGFSSPHYLPVSPVATEEGQISRKASHELELEELEELKCDKPTATDTPDGADYMYCESKNVCLQALLAMDHKYSLKLHVMECGRYMDLIFIVGALLFNARVVVFTLCLSLVLIQSLGAWVWLNASCIATLLLTQLSKLMFRRPRPNPENIGEKLFRFESLVSTYSFPSGDSACASTYALSIILIVHNLYPSRFDFQLISYMLLFLIPLTVFGRVYFGCHFFGDCLAGVTLGAMVPSFIYWMLKPVYLARLVDDQLPSV